jgi:hypothetical protein
LRFSHVLHLPTHCGALVFQLADLKREKNRAQIGEYSGTTQLCQPCFQRDPTPRDNSVFSNRFHRLRTLSQRKACQTVFGRSWLFLLFIVNIMGHSCVGRYRANEIKTLPLGRAKIHLPSFKVGRSDLLSLTSDLRSAIHRSPFTDHRSQPRVPARPLFQLFP